MAEYFNTENTQVRDIEDSEITLDTSSYIHSSPQSWKQAFNEEELTLKQMRALYQQDEGKHHTDLLN